MNAKYNKIFSYVYIVLFLTIISLPLLFINKDSNKISLVENKKLATFPKFYSEEGAINTNYISEFEAYISDNIGFKEEVVVFDISIMYKLFNKMKVPSFIEGKEQNLFYTSGGSGIPTYQGKNLLSEEKMSELSKGYENMQSYFQGTGAEFCIITIPDKENIYPEYFPDDVFRLSSNTRVDELVEYMNTNTDVNILNLKQSLIDNKGSDMLYFKNYDCTHWNMNGAFVGYTKIMEQVKQGFPDVKIFTKDDFEIIAEPTKGTMIHLNTFKSIRNAMSFDDIIYHYYLREGYHAELNAEVPDSISLKANDKFFHYVNKEQVDAPKMLIIGDSYIYSYLLPILAESFSELYFINYTNTQMLMDLQNSIKADFVLYEFVDRVFNENIYSELLYYSATNYELYKDIPFIDENVVFNIDAPAIKNSNVISIDKSLQEQDIWGWAVDITQECLPKAIYLKIGDNYFSPKLIARPDIAVENAEYMMAGFHFNIPTIQFINATSVEFYIISGDGQYQYRPIVYNIELVE